MSDFFDLFKKLLKLLLNIIKVTTVHKNGLKFHKKPIFGQKGKKALSPRPEPFAGARSWPAWQAIPSSVCLKGNSQSLIGDGFKTIMVKKNGSFREKSKVIFLMIYPIGGLKTLLSRHKPMDWLMKWNFSLV